MGKENQLYAKIAGDLQKKIKGEVAFGHDYKALYATDSSNYRQEPIGVVFPKDKEDIFNTVAICRQYAVAILARGGGTSLAGQCCNHGVVLDFSKHYNKILDIDAEHRTARIQTGLVLDDLNRELDRYGLIFGPDPATHNHCTLGGMMGNNSCGIHSVMAQLEGDGARTSDHVEALEVLTYRGEVMEVGADDATNEAHDSRDMVYNQLRELANTYEKDIREGIPKIPRRVSGYNLDDLLPEKFNVAKALVGTESTCALFLEATVKLLPKPKKRSLLLLGYPSVFDAGGHVMEVLEHKPIGLEGMDRKLIGYMHQRGLHEEDLGLLPKGDGWLLVEFGADSKELADEKAKNLMADLKERANGHAPSMKLFDDPQEESRVWEIRESGLGATAFVEGLPDMWPGWEDSAVPPEKVGEYLKDLRKLFQKYDYHPSLYGHFGQGCIHCRVGFDLKTAEGIENYKKFTKEAAQLVVGYGGSLSGEHGDGQARGPLLDQMYSDRLLKAFREFKMIWDPDGKMNPGKVVDADAQDEHLRLGTHFEPKEPQTHFKYPKDKGSFHRAAMRCVGVGECRKTHTGTMCPSYMVTRDEKHVTRGRAHMLFELMRGGELHNAQKNKEVKESLDLCLACKGCLGECPVNVDMATYKAEFFSHYYKNKIRPRQAYAFGLIDKWARLASPMAGTVNAITQSALGGKIFKTLGGLAQERNVPKFAKQPFTKKVKPYKGLEDPKDTVVLWPDTFNNFFFPEVLEAAQQILESAGFSVVVPTQNFCCGRALYDFGMLDRAKAYLRAILDGMQEPIEAGVPFVGLEPSCVAVFRNELLNLYPTDNDAQRLNQNFKTLPEFILDHQERFHFQKRARSVLVHRHCHHHAVMGYAADQKVLEELLGLSVHMPDSGCCGLAGSFGFEKGEKYKISMKAGERRILPTVRNMEEDLLVADGFSCREQIKHGTGTMPLHIAELLADAL